MSFKQKAAIFTFVALSAFSSLHAQKAISSVKSITSPKPLIETICKEKTEAKLVEFRSLKDKPLITFCETHCVVQYRTFLTEQLDSLDAWGFNRLFIEFAPPSAQKAINHFTQTGEMTWRVKEIQGLSASYEKQLDSQADGSTYLTMLFKAAELGWPVRPILYQYDFFENQFPRDSANVRYAFVTDSSVKADGIKSVQLVGRDHQNPNGTNVILYHVSLERECQRNDQKKPDWKPDSLAIYLEDFSSTHGNGLWEVTPSQYILIMGKE